MPDFQKLSYPFLHTAGMELTGVCEIIGELRRVTLAVADKAAVISLLSGVQRLRGMLDAVEIDAARRLHELTHNAPAELAGATQRPNPAGHRVYERSAVLAVVPSLASPLATGALQGAHIDAVAKVRRTVQDAHADAFSTTIPAIIASAATSHATADDLARELTKAARAIENDDGVSRHDQQRRETSVCTWTDKRTGMFRLAGTLDPLNGALLHGRLQAAMAALFAERMPSTCPTHPGAKQDHLRALALLALTIGSSKATLSVLPDASGNPDDEWTSYFNTGRFGRPEVVVVLDARQATVEANGGKPFVDWGIPVELPWRALEARAA